MPPNDHAIRFYRASEEPYGFLSNFARAPFRLHGFLWLTSEHWFQAQKFAGRPEESLVRAATTPGEAARLGRALPGLRADWDAVKESIMLAGLRAKFAVNVTLRDRLLATAERPLIEHTPRDRYWGDGGDGSGKNRLGALLMQVRDELTSR